MSIRGAPFSFKFLYVLPVLVALCGAAPTTAPSFNARTGEKVPSEDPVLRDFHSMGLIDGRMNIFRCACPVRDLVRRSATIQPSNAVLAAASARMQRMRDLGIRTVISFQDAASEENSRQVARSIALEKAAAADVGLTYVAFPIANSGPNSLETMSDAAVQKWLQSVADEIFKDSAVGGVAFHCSFGHDRAGIVAAYLRLKYQHWPVDQAIDEMRRLGHDWLMFSHNGGLSSWHEDHLRAIARMLNSLPPVPPAARPIPQ
jgi:protein-tyrosine phosphatase